MAKQKSKEITLPDNLWVPAYLWATSLGMVNHVSSDSKVYPSEQDCQMAIDKMEIAIGIDRSRYKPLRLMKE